MELTDAALVRRIREGETNAFSILVARYHDQAMRFAVHMLGDHDDADEAVQEAFIRAYRALPRYEDRERFGAWMMRIVVNRCRTAAGRRRRREQTFVRALDATLTRAQTEPSERSAWREEIRRALATLDLEQREAFLLKHVEELSYEEMSEVTGAGVSALKMRVKRACDRLRALLAEVEDVR